MDKLLKGFRILDIKCLDKLKNFNNDEIQSRIAAGNRRSYSLRQMFKSRAMRKQLKLRYVK